MIFKDLKKRNTKNDGIEKFKVVRAAKVASIAVIAAGVGAVGGLLFAPKTGKKTRQDIVRNAKKLKSKLETISGKMKAH